ncbi:aminotransferase [Streptosporangium oxazolinicum]|uniref:Aminotransferase n=2 Tax=Streptosporangium oxazolinicum TaxID=909287 RepID=A0ABP8B7Q7_9ACTN
MAGHDFFTEPDLPRPDVSPETARAVAAEHFGVEGTVEEVGSHQERNFVVDAPSGRFLLKVANPAFSDEELDAQVRGMLHLSTTAPEVSVPRPRLGGEGGYVVRFGVDGTVLRARLLSFVPGFPLIDSPHLAPAVVGRLGALAGRVASGLADFRHPGLDRITQWDIRNARRVCETLMPSMTDRGRAGAVRDAVEASCDRLDALSARLRVQAIHGDITDDNVVCDRERNGRPFPSGVIDFGDTGLGWTVGELATTCASVLHHAPERPLALLAAVRAFHRIVPLTDAEIAALWPAIVARSAVLVVSGVHQGRVDPTNAYALRRQEHEWRAFEAATSLPAEVAHAALRDALEPRDTPKRPGRPAPARGPAGTPLLPTVTEAGMTVLDLSAGSEVLREGTWLDGDAERRIAGRMLAAASTATSRASAVICRYGEARLTRTRVHDDRAPTTVALGTEVFCAPGTPVAAPFAGIARQDGPGSVVLRGDGADLRLTGIRLTGVPGGRLAEGDPLGEVAAHPLPAAEPGAAVGSLFVQLCTIRDVEPPAFVTAETAGAWREVCPDPSPLLGLDCAAPGEPTSRNVLDLRRTALAGVQEHYYDDPPRIERGWRQHLSDLDGRTYLDMVNNVASIGHAHPRLTAAAGRQWDLLNTNSRFNYRAVADFARRLADLLPDPLDTVFLVNSGSEAVDLALRLAQTFTRRQDVVCVAEAYHGWTMGSDAISTSVADNPNALATRPPWVHTVLAPNTFRGRFRGEDAGARYVEDARRVIGEAVRSGRPPAAFVCEALYGNAGGVPLPDGYLRGVYEAVREAGGLCVADEVQVGYGRLGHHFWGFEQQGVTPDIVTIAKAMGNGHPLGAVITRRDVAEEFSANGYFFSSAGGSPVSCAVGMTVLDVIEDEGLQENAVTTGGHLRRRLEKLATDHPIIGAVHGMGLYLGVELVRDRDTLEPATEETAAICERMLELGVIVQPTGDHLNVLKIKPPLCLTAESADFFADTLARTLRDGW